MKIVMRIKKGQVLSSEVDGMQGPHCLEEVKKLLTGMNQNLDEFKDEKKPDFFLPEVVQQSQGAG